MGLRFIDEHYIKQNDTRLILGEIEYLYVEDHLISSDGFIDLSKGRTAAITGLDGYSVPNNTIRFPYQKPHK